jgi:long-chain-fatty-acid--CoA ligase ACSBG
MMYYPFTYLPTQQCNALHTAVMLSNDNATWTAMSLFVGLGADFGRADDPVGEAAVSYLPLSHIAAQIIDMHLPMFCAGRKGSNFVVTFADKNALRGTLLSTLQQARPTFFLGVVRCGSSLQAKELRVYLHLIFLTTHYLH